MADPVTSNSALNYSDWVHQSNTSGQYDGALNYGLFGNIGNWFSGKRTNAEKDYEAYLQNLNRQFELEQINNSRAWEEYMDSTKYQRMVADLKAAGFNPALVLSSGIGAAGQPSSPFGSVSTKYSSAKNKSDNSSNLLTSAAMIMLALARIAIKA